MRKGCSMKCLKCGEKTEVLETIQRPGGTRRRRRCKTCEHRFTTTEVANEYVMELAQEQLQKASRRASGSKFDPEAIAAAIAVDRRKKEIAERQRRQAIEDDWMAYDDAPDHLEESQLKEYL